MSLVVEFAARTSATAALAAAPVVAIAARTSATAALAAVLVVAFAAPALADVTVTNAASLEAAVAGATPGQTITLANGSYTLDKILVAATAGTVGAPIRLAAATPHGASITAAPAAQEAILVQAPYWTIDGIDFHGGTYGVRFITAGQNSVVSRALFSDQTSAAIRADCGGPDTSAHCDNGSLQSIEVTRAATVAGCAYAAIEIVGAANWTIHDAFVHAVAVDALACAGVNTVFGIAVRGNSSSITVDSVAVAGTAIGVSLGPTSQACEVRGAIANGTSCTVATTCAVSSSLVSNALVWDAGFEGVQLDNACTVNLHNATLWNNGGPRSLETSGSGAADISNCILNAAPVLGAGVTNSGSGNLTLPSTADTTWFIDTKTSNFRLLASAPAVDKGVTLADVPHDFDGIPRPQGSQYDVGAFERPTNGYPDGGSPLEDGGSDGSTGSTGSAGGTGSTGGGIGGSTQPQKSAGCDVGFAGGGSAGAIGLVLALLLALFVRRRVRS